MIWYFDDNGTLTQAHLPSAINIDGAMVSTDYLVSQEAWDTLAAAGYYREWREEAIPYMAYWEDPVISHDSEYDPPVALVRAGPKLPVEDIRAVKQQEIEAQVSSPDVRTLIRDPYVQRDLQSEWSAAAERLSELENTPDGEVEAFDPTITVAPPQTEGTEYCDFGVANLFLEPWAGAPDADVGFYAELRILTDEPTIGDQARLQVVSAPSDTGAVLPFTQDADDPSLWVCEARDGHKWVDQEAEVQVRLLWGAGSLPVSPTMITTGMHDRKATPVRYGVAA